MAATVDDARSLGEQDVLVYRTLLQHAGSTQVSLAQLLDVTTADLDKPLMLLSQEGLIRYDGDRLRAVSPMLAEATALAGEDLELNARRAHLEGRRNALRHLIPDWNLALAEATDPGEAVDAIYEPAAIGNVMLHYADASEHEVLTVFPGRVPSAMIDDRTRVANLYSLRRGIKTRALYQHTALRDRASRSFLKEMSDSGARIRLAAAVPGRSMVVDRKVALLPIPTADPSRHGLAVVRQPTVVAWVVSTFEQLWAEGDRLEDVVGTHPEAPEFDRTLSAILRLLAEGEKDEAISRRLSISVRTCRRHIADYMSQVGAGSRFQAGVIAARSRHTDTPTSG